jgi:hypothetical protein
VGGVRSAWLVGPVLIGERAVLLASEETWVMIMMITFIIISA